MRSLSNSTVYATDLCEFPRTIVWIWTKDCVFYVDRHTHIHTHTYTVHLNVETVIVAKNTHNTHMSAAQKSHNVQERTPVLEK